jgi:hypothetical protein
LCCKLAPLVADHSHDTGLFRGWLCTRCNSVLTEYFETPFALAALEYLRTAPERSAALLAQQPLRSIRPGELPTSKRPSKLTLGLLADLARANNRADVIAVLETAHISRRTHQHWRTLGRRGIEPYRQFVAVLERLRLADKYAF